MDEELMSTAAQYFAEACEDSGHILNAIGGSTCRCRELATRLEREREVRIAAETYDVSRALFDATKNGDFPNVEWSAAALVRMLANEIEQAPWFHGSSHKRIIKLTTTIARIGEIGLPPDALVRVGLSRRIQDRIASYVMAVYHGIADQRIKKITLPSQLQDWVDLAERSVHEAYGSNSTIGDARLIDVLTVVQQGLFAVRFKEWIMSAPLSNIVMWEYVEDAGEALTEEDVNLPGGHEAIHWVVDRFSHTHYRSWYRTSLYWELRFANNPEATAAEAGLPLSLLAQRPSHSGLLVESIVARASYSLNHERVIGNISRDELLSYVALLLHEGSIDVAVDVLKEVLRQHPGLSSARSMLGFCLIPKDPQSALIEIQKCELAGEESDELLLVNRAAASWRMGQKNEARKMLEHASNLDSGWMYILWRPYAIVQEANDTTFRVGRYTLKRWTQQMLALMDAQQSRNG